MLVFCLCWLTASAAEAVGLAIGIRPIYADDKERLKLPDTAGCVVVVLNKSIAEPAEPAPPVLPRSHRTGALW